MKNFGILSAAVFAAICFYAADIFAADDAIFKFILKNDVKAVKKAAGPQTLSLRDGDLNTPLLFAVQKAAKAEIITALLEAGANIEERDNAGYTPLMLALKKNFLNPDIAVTLINNKANVHAVFRKEYSDEDRMTPLMFAVSENTANKAKVIQALIDAGSDTDLKRAEDESTPLLMAARYAQDPGIIDILVKAGSNIEEKNKYGYTPLMLALRKNEANPDMAIALIQNKADVNKSFDKKYDDEDKMSPLMYALNEYMLNKPKVIRALADYGADMNARNAKDGYAPLHFAARNAHNSEIVDILIKAGAEIDAKDKYGYTPLMLALRKNDAYPDIAIALIKYKADVNAVFPENSSTPLMMALSDFLSTKPKVIQALTDYGADVNAKNIGGMTPLMFAAKYSSQEIVRMLLKAGADIAAKDKDNKTAENFAQDNAKIYQKDLSKLKP
jgi:ankyrin repeat protein